MRSLALRIALVAGASLPAWGLDVWARCTNEKLPDDKRIGYCRQVLSNGGMPNGKIGVLVVLADIYRNQHQYAQAIELLSHAVAYETLGTSRSDGALPSPDAVNAALRARAEAYALSGQRDLAIADTAAIFKLAPDEAGSYATRCWIRAIMKAELDAALADCNEAAKRDPASAQTLETAAFLQFRLGHLKEAASGYDEALSQNGKLPAALFMRGIIALQSGDTATGNADIAAAKDREPAIAARFADIGVAP